MSHDPANVALLDWLARLEWAPQWGFGLVSKLPWVWPKG